MSNLRIERVNYFTGEALLTADFQCEQNYMRETDAIGRSSLYTYGIAHGLDVSISASALDPSRVQIEVGRGVAIDALGRQIILTQASVLPLRDIENGATYFITINYHEVYADYSDETGSAGYKRVIEQPELRFLRNLDQPGLYILLAVASFAADGQVNALTYKSGNKQRRYVAASLGAVNFITEGSGVGRQLESAELSGANLLTRYASITARRENDVDSYLEFDAARGHFTGLLTSRGSLGVGVEAPVANLQVNAITFKGMGTISSDGVQVTFNGRAPSPFLCKGDTLIADASVAGGAAQSRTVTAIVTPGQVVQVDSAFKSNLTEAPYSFMRSTLARFSASSGGDACLLQFLLDGTVGLGVQAAVKSGETMPGPNALVISKDRKVGIALNGGSPQATLDVNGPVNATALTTSGPITTTDINASGAIKAQSFEGNGSKLQGMAKLSFWTKETPSADLSNLYYDKGNVGILMQKPPAPLSVGGGAAFIGSGFITSLSALKLKGYQTQFLTQVKPGDILAIGTLNNQISHVNGKPSSDTSLTMSNQFGVPVVNSDYSYQSLDGVVTKGKGTVTSNGTQLTGNETKFTELGDGYEIIIPRFTANSNVEQSQTVAAAPTSNTVLTLSAPFVGDVKDLPYSYIKKGTKVKVLGAGTISVNGQTVTGAGTSFQTDLSEGSILFTNPVQENLSMPLKWTVASVEDNFNLTLQKNGGIGAASFTAANSTYMLSPSLLGQFKANGQNAILSPDEVAALPPALLVLTNSDIKQPNTVAINVNYKEVLRQYALQVNGKVSFSGGVDMDDLTVNTLLAKTSVTVAASSSSTSKVTLDAEGNVGASATVQATGIVSSNASLQAPIVYATNTLQSNGNVYANAASGVVQGYKVQSAQLTTTGMQVNTGGSAQISFNGTMQMMGARTTYTRADLTVDSGDGRGSKQYTWTAATDGMVLAMVGQVSYDKEYAGVLAGWTQQGANITSSVFATMTTDRRDVSVGKKGSQTYYVPVPGVFTMPVRNGENWTIRFTANSAFGATPDVIIYWIPFGSATQATPPSFSSPTPPTPPSPITVSTSVSTVDSPAAMAAATVESIAPVPESFAETVMATDVGAHVETLAEPESVPLVSAEAVKPRIDTASFATHDSPDESVTGSPAATRLVNDLLALDAHLSRLPASGSVSASAQETINQRIEDLTQVFGDATHMAPDQTQRAAFVSDLQKIVCSVDANGQVKTQQLQEQDVQNLIDSFAKASGKDFSPEQRGLLDAGVKALVQINDNETNRNDLNLIKQNIDLFLDNVQQALSITFITGDKRLLTRALMRLVGDGRQGDAPSASDMPVSEAVLPAEEASNAGAAAVESSPEASAAPPPTAE